MSYKGIINYKGSVVFTLYHSFKKLFLKNLTVNVTHFIYDLLLQDKVIFFRSQHKHRSKIPHCKHNKMRHNKIP